MAVMPPAGDRRGAWGGPNVVLLVLPQRPLLGGVKPSLLLLVLPARVRRFAGWLFLNLRIGVPPQNGEARIGSLRAGAHREERQGS